jgi:hypothetical protein
MIGGHLGELFTQLFDDASMFPPQDEHPKPAVAAHLAHRVAWYADMVGPFVCAAGRIGTIDALAGQHGIDRVDVTMVVPSGLESLGSALAAAQRCERVRLVGIEIPLGPHVLVDALSHLVPHLSDERHVYLEIPVESVTEHHVHVLAPTGVRLKLRTGGTSIEAFQTEDKLATPILMCAAERLAFKCTAGLHNAIRHRDSDTLFEHHGFLNLMLAARIAAATGSHAATRTALADRDPALVARQVGTLTAADVRAIRALFTSFGTCSIDEPVGDLLDLGLVSVP